MFSGDVSPLQDRREPTILLDQKIWKLDSPIPASNVGKPEYSAGISDPITEVLLIIESSTVY